MNTELDTVATLDAAVNRLNDLLNTVTPGPWTCDEDDDTWRLHGVAFTAPAQPPFPQVPVGKQILKAPKRGTTYAEYWPEVSDGQWIAMMNPIVGAALAAWLSKTADDAREGRERLEQLRFPTAEAALAYTFHHPLQVARGILGLPAAGT